MAHFILYWLCYGLFLGLSLAISPFFPSSVDASKGKLGTFGAWLPFSAYFDSNDSRETTRSVRLEIFSGAVNKNVSLHHAEDAYAAKSYGANW